MIIKHAALFWGLIMQVKENKSHKNIGSEPGT